MINRQNQEQTTLNEVHEIMFLLRGSNAKQDGEYRNVHLGTVLEYLYSQQTENTGITLSKLALVLGMAKRQVKENYFEGLVNFGIISLDTKCQCWKWVGIIAIKNKFGQLKRNTSEDNEFIANSLAETSFMDSIKDKDKEKKE
jgi:hypothetical protein